MDFPPRCASLAPAGSNTPKGHAVPAAMIEIMPMTANGTEA